MQRGRSEVDSLHREFTLVIAHRSRRIVIDDGIKLVLGEARGIGRIVRQHRFLHPVNRPATGGRPEVLLDAFGAALRRIKLLHIEERIGGLEVLVDVVVTSQHLLEVNLRHLPRDGGDLRVTLEWLEPARVHIVHADAGPVLLQVERDEALRLASVSWRLEGRPR